MSRCEKQVDGFASGARLKELCNRSFWNRREWPSAFRAIVARTAAKIRPILQAKARLLIPVIGGRLPKECAHPGDKIFTVSAIVIGQELFDQDAIR